MKYWIRALKGCACKIRIGRYELYTYDGTMAFRQDGSGLTQFDKMSLPGFVRLLRWIDKEEGL